MIVRNRAQKRSPAGGGTMIERTKPIEEVSSLKCEVSSEEGPVASPLSLSTSKVPLPSRAVDRCHFYPLFSGQRAVRWYYALSKWRDRPPKTGLIRQRGWHRGQRLEVEGTARHKGASIACGAAQGKSRLRRVDPCDIIPLRRASVGRAIGLRTVRRSRILAGTDTDEERREHRCAKCL